MNRAYLILPLVGIIILSYFFVSFLLENESEFSLFFEQLSSTPISIFFTTDLFIAAIVFLIFSYHESLRLRIEHWWLILASTVLICPSFAFPLFLSIRGDSLR